MTLDYEPMSAQNWQDPYPVYRQLRDEAPLHRAPDSGTWCLSRHADVVAALRQPEIFSSVAMEKILMMGNSRLGLRDLPALLRFSFRTRSSPLRNARPPPGLINSDPPVHDALRNIVNRGFTPRRIASWEHRMREIVEERIQPLQGGAPFDVVRDLAIPLPVTVIAEVLGVEPGRQHDFKRWSDDIVSFTSGATRGGGMAGILDPMGECRSYVRGIVRARREQPEEDLISVLVDPAREETLDEAEVFGLIILLLVAGNETTTNLIGNTTLALLEHPETLRRVTAEPSLVPALVEETVRWDSPVQLIFRETTRDVELPSGKLPTGASVALLLGAANRDERVFEAAERLDIDRNPAGHVGFGFGVHFCLGASLARLEARVALEALIPELPHRRPTEAHPPLIDSFLVRGPSRLQLVPAN